MTLSDVKVIRASRGPSTVAERLVLCMFIREMAMFNVCVMIGKKSTGRRHVDLQSLQAAQSEQIAD